MTSDRDESVRPRASRRFISSLRDVLFESTSASAVEVSADAAGGVPSPPVAIEPETEAARTAIRAAVEPAIGPGVREFSLQDSALAEALPNAVARRRAALRVLALKGTSREQLCAELEHVRAALDAQRDAFSRKLQSRRDALECEQRAAAERCEQELGIAANEIARLEAELEKQRSAAVQAEARRDQVIALSRAQIAELGQRERGFETALREITEEYQTLSTQVGQE